MAVMVVAVAVDILTASLVAVTSVPVAVSAAAVGVALVLVVDPVEVVAADAPRAAVFDTARGPVEYERGVT